MSSKPRKIVNLGTKNATRFSFRQITFAAIALILAFAGGCTSLPDWVHNGFKVGPNYYEPPAQVAENWIDAGTAPISTEAPDLREWWNVFNDPVLNSLIETAYWQNPTVRAAGTRILEARAQRNIAGGNLFPQLQEAFGDYARVNVSRNTANIPPGFDPYFDNWATGFNLAWEVDFWGRFRRAVESADASLDASIANYDDVVVLLVSEVARAYVDIRTFQQRIRFADENIAEQIKLVKEAQSRKIQGLKPGEIAVQQQRTNQTDFEASKQQLEIGLRQANNRLCTLLGIPPRDLLRQLGDGRIPQTPPEVVVGVPVDLLRRRPDVRRAERIVAAQSARIGIAEADLYPRFTLLGSIGYESKSLANLFSSNSLSGNIGPSIRWDILNYGRIINNVRVQDAQFQRDALTYQNTVLRAGREVEDGLVAFVRYQIQARILTVSAKDASGAAIGVRRRSKLDVYNSDSLFITSSSKFSQQDKLAVAQGNIALSLIQVYKALGGGWEIRLKHCPEFDGGTAPLDLPLQPGPAVGDITTPSNLAILEKASNTTDEPIQEATIVSRAMPPLNAASVDTNRTQPPNAILEPTPDYHGFAGAQPGARLGKPR